MQFTISLHLTPVCSARFELLLPFSIQLPAKRKWNLNVFVHCPITQAIKEYTIVQSLPCPFHKVATELLKNNLP